MKKVAYFTNIAPHYREELWLALVKNIDAELHFYFGKSKSIKSIDFLSNKDWAKLKYQVHEVKNIRYKSRLIFQRQVIREILFKNWDCIILLGDANLISNWILGIIAKIKNIKLIFWGHGLYGNETGVKKLIRKKFYSLSDLNLVYGNWAKNQMLKEGFDPNKIKVIFNSINYEESKALRSSAVDKTYYKQYFDNNCPILIFIGRLTKVKKLNLLIESVNKLTKNGFKLNLMIVGTGECKNELERLADLSKADIFFYGSCYIEKEISKLIANADLCVSPGNVGLTSIHSMSYGTPVCTHDDFVNQMPEFEAITEGVTGCFFSKEKNNLHEVIYHWLVNADDRAILRQKCYEVIDNYFNPHNQSRVMKNAIEELVVR
jgi:glycosyltransferase involved in cell wall biosynthesis